MTTIYNHNCKRCPLHKTAKTVCVGGRGNIESSILLIGEAPGRNEDQQGKPFVGRAGEQLDRALIAAFGSTDCVYITNLVKCRPPKNRNPEEEEIEACGIFLKREFRRMKPRHVVVLGNVAMEAILGVSGVTVHRGTWFFKRGVWHMPTVHPAATLYRPELYHLLQADLEKVAALNAA